MSQTVKEPSEAAPKTYNCPVEATLDVLGGKWKILILWYLEEGTLRFGELRRLLPNVTQKMLTQQLKELAEDGLIRREVYAQVPPKVEYSLTEYGLTVRPIIEMICAWGTEHCRRTGADAAL